LEIIPLPGDLEGGDPIGDGYLTETGPDGQRGFGGKCLPKDARMLAKLLGQDCLLRRALEINDRIRETGKGGTTMGKSKG
jgi:hypothetical protein